MPSINDSIISTDICRFSLYIFHRNLIFHLFFFSSLCRCCNATVRIYLIRKFKNFVYCISCRCALDAFSMIGLRVINIYAHNRHQKSLLAAHAYARTSTAHQKNKKRKKQINKATTTETTSTSMYPIHIRATF